MGLKNHTLVLFATFTVFFSGIAARHVDRPSAGNSLLNNPNILTAVLQSRGTSPNQILERLLSADGNIEEAVNGINEEIKTDLLTVDGDLIRVKQEELRNLITDGIKATIREKFSKNPFLVKILEKRFDELYATVPSDEPIAVPLGKIQELLERTSRSKRDVQARDFDLGAIITDILGNTLRGQIVSLVNGLLEEVKATLQGLYVATPPADDLNAVLTYVVNTLVKRALEIITVVQKNLDQIIIIPPVNGTEVVSRRRREVGEPLAVTDEEGGLDVIMRPILELLASILTPVNELTKTLVDSVLNSLTPIIGSLLITRIRNVVIALIDLLIPANPV
ncbi:uncharacterized protein LOC123005929 [Tribolium madens]|uniref:uncharacterized protein LOC123005929 n=1 Tax=Tribolium madens TaxID=41895 RepID=UPI001CF748BA|nr:uncharacterized protein LOC123005929 [Tribolium madens]